jgi:FkbM family methyltransferase
MTRRLIDRVPAIGNGYRRIRDNWRANDPPRLTPFGFKLVGDASMVHGTFEPEETSTVAAILRDADVFINVGANVGYYCAIALQLGKHTIAFEPMPGNLKRLYKNIQVNQWEHLIEVFPLALSDRIGIVTMFGGGTGASLIEGWAGAPSGYAMSVAMSTMDTVLGTRFDGQRCFILVDVEGAELALLSGATNQLRQSPLPLWMIEISVSEHQPAGVRQNPHLLSTFELMWNNGYDSWSATSEPRLIAPEEVRAVASTGVDTFGTHNFLFARRGLAMDRLVR